MKELVNVEGLQKNFGKFKALENVTFQVKEGEVLGFIGPNGAGKSTTVRVLLGLLKSDGGKASIFGKDVWNDSLEIHKKLSYVPGDVALWGNLTGGEIIELLLKLHGTADHSKKERLIKKFELDVTKKAKSYSKGNRQKVALVAALSTEADLYIFDEPTSGLDPLMEVVFQEEVLRLKKEGKAIILSSHILSEVEKLADRVAIIRQGKVVECGTLNELRHLTRTTITLETKENIKELSKVKGVHDFKVKGNKATFSADESEINAIMKQAVKLDIVRFEAVPPTLEDLFMRHYKA